MPSLLLRILSGFIGGFVVLGAFIFGGPIGLALVGSLVAAIGLFEYSRICLDRLKISIASRVLFWFFSGLLMLATVFDFPYPLATWGAGISIYFSLSLLIFDRKSELDRFANFFMSSALGFVYCALFPGLAIKLVWLENGPTWLLFLMLVVFMGDTFAYFGGRFFGDSKLSPELSPKKTWAGSYSGALGSLFAAILTYYFFAGLIPMWYLAFFSLIAAFVSQAGDLFESLLKRVAHVKDSGSIMPGHGGILDRVDGFYFAAPIIYLAAQLSSNYRI